MTTHAVVRACHFTLVAATVDTVTFSQPGTAVKVTNRDSTQVLYFRTDGTAAVSAADDTYVVPAGIGNSVIAGVGPSGSVSIISSAGGACSVESYSHFAGAAMSASIAAGASDATAANQTTQITSLQLIDDTIIADDAAFTPATTKVNMAGFEADETATDSVDEGDAAAARVTLDRKVIVNPQPHTAGGLTTGMFTGSDGSTILTNAAQVIKASAGQLYGYFINNPNAAVSFVHFYNTAAASVTVGTTNPLFSLQLPATSAANLAFPMGVVFSNAGWSIAATTTAGGASAPSTGLDAIVWFL